jgi:hypothetical protein
MPGYRDMCRWADLSWQSDIARVSNLRGDHYMRDDAHVCQRPDLPRISDMSGDNDLRGCADLRSDADMHRSWHVPR